MESASSTFELTEGGSGEEITISLTLPPDLLCGEPCNVLVKSKVIDENPLHCPSNGDVLPQVRGVPLELCSHL